MPSEVKCRSIVVPGEASMAAAQTLPVTEWHDATATSLVRMEFLYSSTEPQLAVRVFTHLPRLDGVSSTRLALHTLEAIEGTPICSADNEAFKKNPPYKFGARQKLNGLKAAARLIGDMMPTCCCAKPLTPEQVLAPASARAMRAYWAAESTALPAQFTTYVCRKDTKAAYKAFIRALAEWHDRDGFHGYFNLNNQAHVEPGAVVVSIVPEPGDLLDMKARYRHAVSPLAHPVSGELSTSTKLCHQFAPVHLSHYSIIS